MPRLFSSLRFQLIAIVLLSVLPAIVLILYSGLEERGNAALQAQKSAKRLVELASAQQARVIGEARGLLFTLSQSPHGYLTDVPRCSAFFRELLASHPHYLNIGLAGADGRIVCSALPLETPTGSMRRDFLKQASEGEGFAIGGTRFDPSTGKATIDFALPVLHSEAGVKTLVFAAVDLAWLSDLAAFLDLPEGSTLTVIDHEGTVLVRYPKSEGFVGKTFPDAGAIKACLEKGGKGTAETEGIDGVRRLFAFTPLDASARSAILYTGVPTSIVYSGADQTMKRNMIALGLAGSLALIVAGVLGHVVIMRRVDTLIGTASRLAAGDLGARTGMQSGSSELEQLGVAFDRMADSLEKKSTERDRMEAALRRSEEEYRALVERIPVVTYTAALDEARTLSFISPQVEALFGFDQDDFCGSPDTWSARLHPEDRERVLGEWARCAKEKDLFICEYRMLTFNDLVKWIRDEAVIVPRDAGEPFCLHGVLMDITEQKRYEEELVKANKELELRVAQRTEALSGANEELRQSAENLKSFGASVVHDLKSPAIGVHGLTKLLWKQYGNALDEKGMHYCDQIMKASEHVVELVENINGYIATKETPLHIESVDLRKLLCDLGEEFSLRLAARSIRWIEPDEEITVKADRLSLLRTFRNLIDNALKYGGEQLSEIRIGYEESESHHIFLVSDNGRGLSKEDAERVFEKFQRSGSSNEIEGAGLGLAIVRETVQRHGGSVSIGEGIEGGVTFRCSIAKSL